MSKEDTEEQRGTSQPKNPGPSFRGIITARVPRGVGDFFFPIFWQKILIVFDDFLQFHQQVLADFLKFWGGAS